MVGHHQRQNMILTVDSDSTVRESIGQALQHEGHTVIEAADGQTAVKLAREYRPDVIILNVMLSDMDGMELCAVLRRLPYVNHTPILFVSAHHGAQFAAQALDCGGDDYLRKPFATRELTARVRALLRRSSRRLTATQAVLRLDHLTKRVIVDGRVVQLTPTEFSLLAYLCNHLGELHTAQDLLERLWGYPAGGGDTALVRNHIRNLRRKMERDPDHPAIIVSLHGRGYTLNARIG